MATMAIPHAVQEEGADTPSSVPHPSAFSSSSVAACSFALTLNGVEFRLVPSSSSSSPSSSHRKGPMAGLVASLLPNTPSGNPAEGMDLKLSNFTGTLSVRCLDPFPAAAASSTTTEVKGVGSGAKKEEETKADVVGSGKAGSRAAAALATPSPYHPKTSTKAQRNKRDDDDDELTDVDGELSDEEELEDDVEEEKAFEEEVVEEDVLPPRPVSRDGPPDDAPDGGHGLPPRPVSRDGSTRDGPAAVVVAGKDGTVDRREGLAKAVAKWREREANGQADPQVEEKQVGSRTNRGKGGGKGKKKQATLRFAEKKKNDDDGAKSDMPPPPNRPPSDNANKGSKRGKKQTDGPFESKRRRRSGRLASSEEGEAENPSVAKKMAEEAEAKTEKNEIALLGQQTFPSQLQQDDDDDDDDDDDEQMEDVAAAPGINDNDGEEFHDAADALPDDDDDDDDEYPAADEDQEETESPGSIAVREILARAESGRADSEGLSGDAADREEKKEEQDEVNAGHHDAFSPDGERVGADDDTDAIMELEDRITANAPGSPLLSPQLSGSGSDVPSTYADPTPAKSRSGHHKSSANGPPSPRWGHTLTLIDHSRCAVYGGMSRDPTTRDGLRTSSDLKIYDSATGKWSTPVNCEGVPRQWHTATFLPERQLLITFGGESANPDTGKITTTDKVMVLDTDLMLWYPPSVSGQNPTGRSGHTATLLPNANELVVFGGVKGSKWQNSVAVLDTARWKWSMPRIAGDAPRPRSYHTAVGVGGGTGAGGQESRLVIFGGNDDSRCFDTVHVLTAHGDDAPGAGGGGGGGTKGKNTGGGGRWSWSHPEVSGTAPTARTGHVAVLLEDGKTILVYGGWDPNEDDEEERRGGKDGEGRGEEDAGNDEEEEEEEAVFSDSFLLDTENWTWSPGPKPRYVRGPGSKNGGAKRVGHAAVLAPGADGARVLAFGGRVPGDEFCADFQELVVEPTNVVRLRSGEGGSGGNVEGADCEEDAIEESMAY